MFTMFHKIRAHLKNRPHGIFLRGASFWGVSGKMIPVMHSAPKLRGFSLTQHPVLTALRASCPPYTSPPSKPLSIKFPRGPAKRDVFSCAPNGLLNTVVVFVLSVLEPEACGV